MKFNKSIYKGMKRLCTLLLYIIYINSLSSQTTIRGTIIDSLSNEPLIGANIFIPSLNFGVTTDSFGRFSCVFNETYDNLELKISYVGYVDKTLVINSSSNFPLSIKLININIEQINITATRISNELGYLNKKTLELYPTVLDNDIIKSIQNLPGIQGTTEGQSNFIARGGNPDQNLILIDNVPIYSPTHALGFVSAINSDIIDVVNLKKEGIPVEYGGRISSVFDISIKDGDFSKFKADIGIGLLNSSFKLEGPILKDKTSFLISYRRTYLDLLLSPFKNRLFGNKSGSQINPNVFFHDTNLKIKHIINSKNDLTLNIYNSLDYFNLEYLNSTSTNSNNLRWMNLLGSVKWNYEINPNVMLTTGIYSTDFNNSVKNSLEINNEEYKSQSSLSYLNSINDISFSSKLEYLITDNLVGLSGFEAIKHDFNTGQIHFINSDENIDTDTIFGNKELAAFQYNIYSSLTFNIKNFKVIGGIRGSGFQSYDQFNYFFLPRLKFRYNFHSTDFFLTYDKTVQFVNQLISSSIILPTDIWVPAPKNLNPQIGNQITVGSNIHFNSMFSLSVLGYYKKMQGVLAYREGENFLTLNDLTLSNEYNWENKIIQGNGSSRGLEFLIQENSDFINGFLSYSISKTDRTFKELNQGKSFPFRYDRTHNISISILFPLTSNINFSTSWKYSTGIVTTLPNYRYPIGYEQFYDQDGKLIQGQYNQIITFDEKNSVRLSNYNRLDLQLTYDFGFKNRQKFIFGIYNVYFRKNPYVIESWIDSSGNANFREVSLLPFAIPTIIYKYKID